jgi:hypothetical protein
MTSLKVTHFKWSAQLLVPLQLLLMLLIFGEHLLAASSLTTEHSPQNRCEAIFFLTIVDNPTFNHDPINSQITPDNNSPTWTDRIETAKQRSKLLAEQIQDGLIANPDQVPSIVADNVLKDIYRDINELINQIAKRSVDFNASESFQQPLSKLRTLANGIHSRMIEIEKNTKPSLFRREDSRKKRLTQLIEETNQCMSQAIQCAAQLPQLIEQAQVELNLTRSLKEAINQILVDIAGARQQLTNSNDRQRNSIDHLAIYLDTQLEGFSYEVRLISQIETGLERDILDGQLEHSRLLSSQKILQISLDMAGTNIAAAGATDGTANGVANSIQPQSRISPNSSLVAGALNQSHRDSEPHSLPEILGRLKMHAWIATAPFAFIGVSYGIHLHDTGCEIGSLPWLLSAPFVTFLTNSIYKSHVKSVSQRSHDRDLRHRFNQNVTAAGEAILTLSLGPLLQATGKNLDEYVTTGEESIKRLRQHVISVNSIEQGDYFTYLFRVGAHRTDRENSNRAKAMILRILKSQNLDNEISTDDLFKLNENWIPASLVDLEILTNKLTRVTPIGFQKEVFNDTLTLVREQVERAFSDKKAWPSNMSEPDKAIFGAAAKKYFEDLATKKMSRLIFP